MTAISPTSADRRGTTVTITGTGFTGATGVDLGVVVATSFTVVSNTEITFVTPKQTAGLHNVTVAGPTGTSADVNADLYTDLGPPAVTSISPTSGLPAGGNTVTITGTGFTGATGVDLGVVPATSFTVVSATQIAFVAPAQTAGLHNVTVTTPNGTSADVNGDLYTDVAPTVTAISPTSGPTAGGTTVTITGTGFTGATGVDLGVVVATSFTVVSNTEITFVTPKQTAGLHNVTVAGPTGTSADVNADLYTDLGPPAVTSISPTSGLPRRGQHGDHHRHRLHRRDPGGPRRRSGHQLHGGLGDADRLRRSRRPRVCTTSRSPPPTGPAPT